MASDLTPGEKDEREAERLIGRKPVPSRKHTERRGPKFDNRRRRVQPDKDADTEETKEHSASLMDSALRIMFRSAADDPPDTLRSPEIPKKVPSPKKPSAPKLEKKPSAPKLEKKPAEKKPAEKKPAEKKPAAPKLEKTKPDKSAERLSRAVSRIEVFLRNISPPLAKSFASQAASRYPDGTMSPEESEKIVGSLSKELEEVKKNGASFGKAFASTDSKALSGEIASAWPSKGNEDWASRAAVITGIRKAMGSVPIPDAFKAPFERLQPGDMIKDRDLIKKIVQSTVGGPSTKDVKSGVVLKFAQLAAALRILSENPDSVDSGSLSAGMDKLSKVIEAQARQLLELGSIMDGWHEAMDTISSGEHVPDAGKDFDRVQASLKRFFDGSKKPVVDPRVYMDELRSLLKEKYGDIPKEMEPMLRAAASYEGPSVRVMATREAAYHGVKGQGHPSGPTNTGYSSYDKRYFGKDNYDSILKYAKQLLQEDWLKYDWDGGAEDARFRAALDLSIHLADSSLYQSKIDTETYDMLLSRLAGWEWDTFSDTVLPVRSPASRSASNMNQTPKNLHAQKIYRIASDLRQTNPKMAFEIVKSMRALVSSEAASGQAVQAHVAQQQGEEEHGGHTSQQEVQGQQQPIVSQQEQHAVDPGDEIKMQSVSEEDFKKLKEEAKKLFDAKDISEFMEGLDEVLDVAGIKTASMRVPLSLLVRIAHAIPASRQVLVPILAAVKKKDDKKKGKKTSQKGKKTSQQETKSQQDQQSKGKGKKPPFGGKKAPPFGGKKAPPFGKKGRKAAVEIETSDLSW